jgi:hypothetical protein
MKFVEEKMKKMNGWVNLLGEGLLKLIHVFLIVSCLYTKLTLKALRNQSEPSRGLVIEVRVNITWCSKN